MADELCRVELKGVGEDRLGIDWLLLEDAAGRHLPIWIGRCEAISIALKLQETTVQRPLTHDMLCHSVERLGGRLTRVIIDDLWQDTYYAKVCLTAAGSDEEMQVDCRPSDALAMAIRAGVPIFVREDVLEEGKFPQPTSSEAEAEGDESQDE